MFREYPYLNLQDLNLDYILRKIREMQTELNNFVVTNAIKYADPIDWNITTQYEKNTVVIDANSGIAYLSVQPVPSGVAITNTDYWTVIFDLSMFIDKNAKNLTDHVEGQTNTATFNSAVGAWLIWYDELYIATNPINAGDAYVVGSNIDRITVEDVIKSIVDNINTLGGQVATNTADIVILKDDFDALDKMPTVLSTRYGSMNIGTDGQQGATYYNGFFYICSDLSTSFKITKYDDQLQIDSSYTYNYACHPNSIFAYNGNFYVVDSSNYYLYVIDINTMTISQIITDYTAMQIASGYEENDKIYLYGNNIVYVYDNTFTLLEQITLEVPEHFLPAIHQGIFVYNGVICRVWNYPNAITLHDATGACTAIKNIGLGSGYFPYGEIETFFIKDGFVCFNSVLWSSNPLMTEWVGQIFYTNIGKKILSDDRIGQNVSVHELIRCGNRTDKNPTGHSSNPFDNLYEASCVYSYLYNNYPYVIGLYIADNIFASQNMIVQNCTMEIRPTNVTIGTISVYNATLRTQQLSIDTLVIQNGHAELNRCTINTLGIYNGSIVFGGSTVASAYTTQNALILDSDVKYSGTEADCDISGGYLPRIINPIGDGYTVTPTPINPIVKKGVFVLYKGFRSVMRVAFTLTGGNFAALNFEEVLQLPTANKNAFNNGTNLGYIVKKFVKDNANNVGVLEFTFNVDPNTDTMYANNVTFKALDGTSLTAPNNIYPIFGVVFETDFE